MRSADTVFTVVSNSIFFSLPAQSLRPAPQRAQRSMSRASPIFVSSCCCRASSSSYAGTTGCSSSTRSTGIAVSRLVRGARSSTSRISGTSFKLENNGRGGCCCGCASRCCRHHRGVRAPHRRSLRASGHVAVDRGVFRQRGRRWLLRGAQNLFWKWNIIIDPTKIMPNSTSGFNDPCRQYLR